MDSAGGSASTTIADDWGQDVQTDAELLRKAWRNEKTAPEILAFQTVLVERIKEQIAHVVHMYFVALMLPGRERACKRDSVGREFFSLASGILS